MWYATPMARRLACVVLLATASWLGGCATGSGADGDDGGGQGGSGAGTVVGLDGYAFRAPLTLENAADDLSVRLTMDHASLVAAGSAREDGSDVRVAFVDDAGNRTELDRILDPPSTWNSSTTSLFFRSRPADAGPGTYYVYYGHPDPDAPPADAAVVFDAWDDFDTQDDETWTLHEIGDATDSSFSVVQGSGRVSGTTQNLAGTADDFVFLSREVSGDFLAEVEVANAGGSLGGGAKTGGLMVRQSVAPESRHVTASLLRNPRSAIGVRRETDGGDTADNQTTVSETYPIYFRVQRVGGTVTAQYSENGTAFTSLGAGVDLGLTDPVLLGIPLANISGAPGNVDTAWFRLRAPNLPEPRASLGPEEAL